MIEPRLATRVRISALLRRCHAAGGSGAVLMKGDETAGALLILCREKGRISALLEETRMGDGPAQWEKRGPQDVENEGDFDHYIQRRRASDPDLWVVELDIPNAERFVVLPGCDN